ncbi:hypothetical protein B0H10DRAFT_2229350 [Mycena sp. CBHHK59/15]|nr:hypothetical protein B0H10DRAFT_2229350 [Mycena sp. CBHHK59/15]
MPRARKQPSNAQRGSKGMFISNYKLPPSPESGSEDSDLDDETAWESATDDVEPEDPSYLEAWQDLPLPMTFDERAEKRADQRKRAEEKRLIAEMRGAEHREAGAPDNQKVLMELVDSRSGVLKTELEEAKLQWNKKARTGGL